MDFSIKTLDNGDFEVCHFYNCNCSNCMDDLERKIKEAMEIPVPDNDLEKHLPGISADDFSCILCDAGVPLVAAQPQQHQATFHHPPLVGDFMWAVAKLHNGKEYFLKRVREDGKREWTADHMNAWMHPEREFVEEFINKHIGKGQAGVRGFLVGG